MTTDWQVESMLLALHNIARVVGLLWATMFAWFMVWCVLGDRSERK